MEFRLNILPEWILPGVVNVSSEIDKISWFVVINSLDNQVEQNNMHSISIFKLINSDLSLDIDTLNPIMK